MSEFTGDMKDHDILIRIDENVKGINKRLDKQNGRIKINEDDIDGLKGWRNRIAGAMALVVVLFSAWMKWG